MGPAIVVFAPAILCLLMRRIGFSVISAVLSVIGWTLVATPTGAGAGTAGAFFVASSWAMLIPAHAAAHREHLSAEARRQMALLAERIRELDQRTSGAGQNERHS